LVCGVSVSHASSLGYFCLPIEKITPLKVSLLHLMSGSIADKGVSGKTKFLFELGIEPRSPGVRCRM